MPTSQSCETRHTTVPSGATASYLVGVHDGGPADATNSLTIIDVLPDRLHARLSNAKPGLVPAAR